MLTLLALTLALPAHSADNATLRAGLESASGWEEVDRKKLDPVGEVVVRHKKVAGEDCLEGTATARGAVDTYVAASMDINHQGGWSTWKVPYSKKLSNGATSFDYVQVLDNPAPVSDRYWFLRGTQFSNGADRGFRWEPIDGAAAYPEAYAEVTTKYSGAVVPSVNVGDWTFSPAGAGQTKIRYRICTNAGGSLPSWAGEFAATRTLPTNLADIAGEVGRRTPN